MKDDSRKARREEMVLSHHRVRMALGVLGVALPLMLIIGGLLAQGRIQPSVSDFFHTTLRDIYVGGLCAIGVFLISYKGYSRNRGEWLSDNVIATVGGIAAFGVAFFPNESPTQIVETVSQEALGLRWSPYVHYTCAFVFFLCLSLFCYVKFPRTAKPRRRRIYLWCGHLIWVAGFFILTGSHFKNAAGGGMHDFVTHNNIVFWAEAMGIWVFATAWLTKGKADLALAQAVQRSRRKTNDKATAGQGTGKGGIPPAA